LRRIGLPLSRRGLAALDALHAPTSARILGRYNKAFSALSQHFIDQTAVWTVLH
jgi:hypothetical protein